MRVLLAGSLLLFFGWQQQMTVPKVEHTKRVETQTYDDVKRSCPAGYEGHFVDVELGFNSWDRPWSSGIIMGSGTGYSDPGYTICFDKKFMDEVRKNPELLVARPLPPRPS